MRRTPPPHGARPPAHRPSRRWWWLALAALGAWPGSAAAQAALDQDKIDISGRASLTLGSGARAFGMGGAFLARADDATAASWNPAGLSYLRVPEASLAGNRSLYRNEEGISPNLDLNRFAGESLDFAAVTWPVRMGGASGAVQMSFQRAVPFGGSLTVVQQRGEDQEARVSTGEASGGFDLLAFGTGWRLTRTFRAGITINRWFNGYDQTRETIVPGSSRPNRIFATDFGLTGWNANLGVVWSPVEQINLGAVFKTPFTGQVTLDKVRTDIPVDGSATTRTAYQSDAVRLRFPAAFGFGTSWRPRSEITLSADFTRTFWSRSHIDHYFTLTFTAPTFYDPLPYPALNKPEGDTDQVRFGLEYVLIRSRIKIPLRAGYFNDEQIVRPAAGGTLRFNGVTVGMGISLGPVLFDVAYLYESGRSAQTISTTTADMTVSAETRTTLRTERFFVSLIYRLGGSN